MAKIDISDIMGVKELSAALKELGYPWVERTNITTWIARRDSYATKEGAMKAVPNGFPGPKKVLGMGGIYSWPEVLQWVVDHYGTPDERDGAPPTRGGSLPRTPAR